MRYFRSDHRRWEKTPGALVTEADLAIDGFLKQHLPRGDDAWLSEETPDDRERLGAARVWIVDPIDGTRSYAGGKPEFAVSVALWEAGRVVLGIVLNPATDELFVAGDGRPTTLNARPTRLRAWTPAGATLLLVSGREAREAGFQHHFAHCEIKGLGSLAYRLALIAAGRADGLVSLRRVADWDLAAAAAMIENGGGVLTDRRGRRLRINAPEPLHDGLVAAGPVLHTELLAHLGSLR